jgi:hypothetical protein
MEKQKRKPQGRNYFLEVMGFIFSGSWKILSFILKGIWSVMSFFAKGIWSGLSWLFKLPYRLLRYIISGRVPRFENARQEEIFWRIKRQYRRKRFFALHLMFYMAGFIAGLGISISEYLRLAEQMLLYPEYNYWDNFYSMIISMGAGLGIWTLIILFHFIFNRMGNEEDKALGAALEQEYTRSDERSYERYERLHEDVYEDDEIKPKQNGIRS